MFEFERARDLAQLGAETAMLARLQQAGDLHGQSRGAGDDVAAGGELERGTAERPRIDVFHGRRQPPAALAGGISAQQLALPVEHDMRGFEILAERRPSERIHVSAAGQRGQKSRAGKAREGEPPSFHLAAVMSIAAVAVRPKRSGRYMSST